MANSIQYWAHSRASYALFVQESRFTKCDTCTLVKNELQKTTDSERRKYYADILEKHNALQRYVNVTFRQQVTLNIDNLENL